MWDYWFRILGNQELGNRCRGIIEELNGTILFTLYGANDYNFYIAGVDHSANNNEHLSSSDTTSTVSMSMSNPNGNASTDGVLTVTVQNDNKSKHAPTLTNGAAELKSSLKKRSNGSVSSTSYPNHSLSNK